MRTAQGRGRLPCASGASGVLWVAGQRAELRRRTLEMSVGHVAVHCIRITCTRLRAEFNMGVYGLRADWDFGDACALKRRQLIFQRLVGTELSELP